MEHAELALINGRIITVDPQDSLAEAIAVRGGKIIRVGDDIAVEGLVGPDTTVVDLKGRTVLPGFINSHVHASGAGLLTVKEYVDIKYANSIVEVKERIEERAVATPARARYFLL
jgi:predicted amidohydrolase YtcJ